MQKILDSHNKKFSGGVLLRGYTANEVSGDTISESHVMEASYFFYALRLACQIDDCNGEQKSMLLGPLLQPKSLRPLPSRASQRD